MDIYILYNDDQPHTHQPFTVDACTRHRPRQPFLRKLERPHHTTTPPQASAFISEVDRYHGPITVLVCAATDSALLHNLNM